jgi:hypothetical protein
MKKRTLITGMVGSHLADFLSANAAWDIFGMCRWRSPLDNVADFCWIARIKRQLLMPKKTSISASA